MQNYKPIPRDLLVEFLDKLDCRKFFGDVTIVYQAGLPVRIKATESFIAATLTHKGEQNGNSKKN